MGLGENGSIGESNWLFNFLKKWFTPSKQSCGPEDGFTYTAKGYEDLPGNMSHLEYESNNATEMDISLILNIVSFLKPDIKKRPRVDSRSPRKKDPKKECKVCFEMNNILNLFAKGITMTTLPKDIKEAVSKNIPKISASKDEVQSIMKDEVEVILDGYFIYGNSYPDSQYIEYNFKILKNGNFEKDSTYYEAF